jgi:hypothetical protein
MDYDQKIAELEQQIAELKQQREVEQQGKAAVQKFGHYIKSYDLVFEEMEEARPAGCIGSWMRAEDVCRFICELQKAYGFRL